MALFSTLQQSAPSQPFANTAPGIALNTITGLPKAAVDTGIAIGQGIARSVGSAALTLAKPLGGVDDSLQASDMQNPVSKQLFSSFFGSAPIKPIEDNIAQAEIGIKMNPTAQKMGLDKVALPLAFGGVYGSDLLNLVPFGGLEKNAVDTLAKETSVEGITKILSQMKVPQEIATKFAPHFADASTPQEVNQVLDVMKGVIGVHGVDAVNAAKGVVPGDAKATLANIQEKLGVKPVEIPPEEPKPVAPSAPVEQTPAVADAQKSALPETAGSSSAQDTINKVELNVKGDTVPQRVQSSIANSESLRNQIVNKGQEAYSLGKGLSASDLKLAEGYDQGKSIPDLAAKAQNPGKFTTFMDKLTNYYDFRLAADRAAGGTTAKVANYIPHQWNLSNPADLARFNQFAEQKGIRPYDGFSAQPRVFSSYAEGEAAGFKRANPNILGDLKSDFTVGSHVISTQALKQGLGEAAPDMVSMSGTGLTESGKPFVNSNIRGLEGISYHPTIDRLLQGFQPLKHPDFVKLVQESGAKAAVDKTGLGAMVDRTVASLKSVPANAKEAGFTGTLGSIYDHVSSPMKQVLWNWSGFHSLNITLSHVGASTLHPVTGSKGVLQSVGSLLSERLYNASINNYKNVLVKDTEGVSHNIFDWAVKSGAYEARALPVEGAAKFNPFKVGQQAIFDREIPILQLNLAEQAAKKGIVPDSPQGLALGREIRQITGEVSAKKMNINPNTLKVASRLFLAPGFTISKYRTLSDSFTQFGKTNGAAGNLARSAVIGKSAAVGTMATLGTLLATGKFPHLSQILLNYTVNPTSQTNIKNPKGQLKDISYPKTFVSEPVSALLDPQHYALARLNPLISDFVKVKTNQDYYSRPIVDPNVPKSAASQITGNLGIGHLPIGAQALVSLAQKKQGGIETALQIAGLSTKVSASDPSQVKYAHIDSAISKIGNIAPDDPQRYQKIANIYNGLSPSEKKSVNYKELIAGVKLKPPKNAPGGLFSSL